MCGESGNGLGVEPHAGSLLSTTPIEGKLTMRKLPHRRFVRNVNQHDLFIWAAGQRQSQQRESMAVREISRRGFRPSTARLIAELAGYPREAN